MYWKHFVNGLIIYFLLNERRKFYTFDVNCKQIKKMFEMENITYGIIHKKIKYYIQKIKFSNTKPN